MQQSWQSHCSSCVSSWHISAPNSCHSAHVLPWQSWEHDSGGGGEGGGGDGGGGGGLGGEHSHSNEAPANRKLRPDISSYGPSTLYSRSMHPISANSNMTERARITPFSSLGSWGLSQPKPSTVA